MDRRAQANRRIGSTIAGRYTLLDVLGAGGMGAVFRARHEFTHDYVAVKLLYADVAGNNEAVQRFVQEARAPASIGHPGIVKIFDAGVDPSTGEMYLAMEILDGEDLATNVERGGMELATLLDLTLQVLDALGAAHLKGFVHRDIKPENVFLVTAPGAAPRAKLLDFGVARYVDPSGPGLTQMGSIIGTPWYMSPEQVRGEPVDGRADLWSLGALLFHALTGRPPFDDDQQTMVFVAIMTTEAPSLATLRPDLPQPLVAVVDRALQRDLTARWQSADELAAAIRAVLANLNASAIRIGSTLRKRQTKVAWSVAPEVTRRVGPRTRVLLAGAILLSVALGVVVAWPRGPRALGVPAASMPTIGVAMVRAPSPAAPVGTVGQTTAPPSATSPVVSSTLPEPSPAIGRSNGRRRPRWPGAPRAPTTTVSARSTNTPAVVLSPSNQTQEPQVPRHDPPVNVTGGRSATRPREGF